jgi:hypothetical protein
MFCSHCGSPVQTGDHYCANCGNLLQSGVVGRSRFWYKIISCVVLVVVIFMGWVTYSPNDIEETIENHLRAISSSNITEAYYEHLSTNFQNQTPLPAFRELVSAIPVLSNNTGVRCHECNVNENEATVHGILTSLDDEMVPVEYKLIKEDNRWKIDDMTIAMGENVPAPKASTPGLGTHKIATELFIPIDLQLKYIRAEDISKAYSETLSKEFKKSTTLQAFKDFVKSYPVLIKHGEVEVRQPTPQDEKVLITVILNPDTEAVPIDYILINEEGKWKIWNMAVTPQYWGGSSAKDLSTIKKNIESFLQGLQTTEIAKIYNQYTSQEFQKKTSLESFQSFLTEIPILTQFNAIDLKEPTFTKGTGSLDVYLKSPYGTAIIAFTMGVEDNQWKIWAINVVKQGGVTDKSRETRPIAPPLGQGTSPSPMQDGIPLEFTRMDIGTRMDLKGEVINPTTIITSNREEIHVNLFIKHGKRWAKIEVLMEHLETRSSIPAISTTLQQDGEVELSFVFTPPPAGWPKGHYEIVAMSSTGETRVFPFEIRMSPREYPVK